MSTTVGVARGVAEPRCHHGTMPATPAENPALWYAMPVLAGDKIRLEPLAVEHASGYFKAASPDEDEVFRWLNVPPPENEDAAREQILAALAARARGERFAYAQVDAVTREFAGTTSFYEVNPAMRAIGSPRASPPAELSDRPGTLDACRHSPLRPRRGSTPRSPRPRPPSRVPGMRLPAASTPSSWRL